MDVDSTKNTLIGRRVLHGTISNYAGQFVTLGVGFLLTPFILRSLGETGYGLWLLVGSVVAYGALLDFGIFSAIIKYIPDLRARGEHEKLRSLVATAFRLYCLLGLFAFALSAVIAPIFPHLFNVPSDQHTTAAALVLLMGLALAISIPTTITTAILRGLQHYEAANTFAIVGTLLSAGVTVIVLSLGGGVLGMVAFGIPIALLMQIPAVWYIHRVAPELRLSWWGAKWSHVRTIISFSWSLSITEFAGQIGNKTGGIVIGAFLPVSMVAPYGIALRLSELPQLLARQFIKVLFPLASELNAVHDLPRVRALYLTSSRLTLALLLPIGCTVVILARPFLNLWVGPTYAGYGNLVFLLVMAVIIDTSLWPAASVLQGLERHRPLAIFSIVSASLNLALTIILVQRFGIIGVALGILIPAAFAGLLFTLPYALRVMSISLTEFTKKIFFPALLPAIPMVIILYLLQLALEPLSLLSLLVVVGISFLFYVAGYISFGASAVERQAFSDFALSTIRFAKAHLRLP